MQTDWSGDSLVPAKAPALTRTRLSALLSALIPTHTRDYAVFTAESRLLQAAGNSSQKRLPWPGSDSTPQVPPIRCMARATMAKPMPVPS